MNIKRKTIYIKVKIPAYEIAIIELKMSHA
jgi:hypothetical protein